MQIRPPWPSAGERSYENQAAMAMPTGHWNLQGMKFLGLSTDTGG
jgi:hypothetical protein